MAPPGGRHDASSADQRVGFPPAGPPTAFCDHTIAAGGKKAASVVVMAPSTAGYARLQRPNGW